MSRPLISGSLSASTVFAVHGSRPWNWDSAGVFAIFDLDSQSFDLINADYLVSIPFTNKKGNFANLSVIFVWIDKNG